MCQVECMQQARCYPYNKPSLKKNTYINEVLPVQYLKCHEECTQQPNCYPCSKSNVKIITCNKSNVIHVIKHISFFFPRDF